MNYKNSIYAGILTVAIGICVSIFLQKIVKTNLPDECKHWNDNHIMEIALFLTGVLVFIIMKY